MWSSVLTEVIREARFWGPQPNNCLGSAAIALLVLLGCCLGLCIGAVCSGLVLSSTLRRVLGFCFRVTSYLKSAWLGNLPGAGPLILARDDLENTVNE